MTLRTKRRGQAAFVCLLLVTTATAAQAQQPPIPGLAADGSLTADGTTFSAEDLEAMVQVFLINPAGLPADLPGTVRSAVYRLSAGRQPQQPLPVPAPAGGAP